MTRGPESATNLTESNMSVNSRLLVILVVVLGVVATIAVIIAAVALGRPAGTTVTVQNQPDGNVNSATNSTQNGRRIWTIAFIFFKAYSYMDDQGNKKGFAFDLIDEVCAAANIECRTIWDMYTNCWDSQAGEHPVGGQGLMDGWYDACSTWLPTIGRIQVFSFSDSWSKPVLSYFYVNYNDTTFNPEDITGKKIVFVDGIAYDEKCVARQRDAIKGSYIDPSNIVHVIAPFRLVEKIVSGEVAAGFISEENMERYARDKKVKRVGKAISCALGGFATMARKDSPFIDHWNRGFRIIKKNGKFESLCKSEIHKDQGDIECDL